MLPFVLLPGWRLLHRAQIDSASCLSGYARAKQADAETAGDNTNSHPAL